MQNKILDFKIPKENRLLLKATAGSSIYILGKFERKISQSLTEQAKLRIYVNVFVYVLHAREVNYGIKRERKSTHTELN